MEIVVVANPHRQPLIGPFLAGVSHRISVTPDYPLPSGFRCDERYAGIRQNLVGAFRCFRGHQDAVGTVTSNAVLVLEDDAVPHTPTWLDVARRAAGLLDRFEVVSIHGRGFDHALFAAEWWDDRLLLVPATPPGRRCVLGSLAYVMGRRGIDHLLSLTFRGNPMDLLLVNDFDFALVDPSPLDHDRRQGSVVEGARRTGSRVTQIRPPWPRFRPGGSRGDR